MSVYLLASIFIAFHTKKSLACSLNYKSMINNFCYHKETMILPVVTIMKYMKEAKNIKKKIRMVSIVTDMVGNMEEKNRDGRSMRIRKEVE